MTKTTGVAELAREVEALVADIADEGELTARIAERLRARLARGIRLDASVTAPSAERYVMYPLHVDPQGRFSIASAVWNVGQETPVHGHETWGVVGIYSGVEHEVSFEKPRPGNERLRANGEASWKAGEVTVCCTTDDDVHQVSCEGDAPCVGIHVYGADIGAISRRAYDPGSGRVRWFTSTWAQPADA